MSKLNVVIYNFDDRLRGGEMKSAYLTTSILANLQQTIPPILSGRTVLSLQSITDPTGNSNNREHPVSDKNLASWDEKNHFVTFCRQVLVG